MEESPKQKHSHAALPLALAIVAMIGLVAGFRMKDARVIWSKTLQEDRDTYNQLETPLLQAIRYVDAHYVDSLDKSALSEQVLRHLLAELDPHSIYLPPQQYREMRKQIKGYFTGIGVNVTMYEDTARIGSVLEDSPAAEGGLVPGDKILLINGDTVAGRHLTEDSLVTLLKGAAHDTLRMTVRSPDGQLRRLRLKREDISLPSVPAAFMLDDKTGYLAISSFTSNTSREFAQALQKLVQAHHLQNLVLDLRGNPGGYLEEAVQVLDHLFTEKDKLLVYTQGAKVGRKDYETDGQGRFRLDRIAVLIDENTASAAEIVAGALQDWDKAVLVGRRSFGKGLVQEEMPLSNGGAVRITVARYYTPAGRCIQKDYSDQEEYAHELDHRFEDGELFDSARYVVHTDTVHYTTIGGREVHGGGGITPEVVVPLEPIYHDTIWLTMQAHIFAFAAAHPEWLPGEDEATYLQRGTVPERAVEAFLRYVQDKLHLPVPPDKQQYAAYIRRELKRQYAGIKFGDGAYYKARAADDDFVKAAVRRIYAPKLIPDR